MKEKQEIKIQSPKKEKQAVKRLGKRKKRAGETHIAKSKKGRREGGRDPPLGEALAGFARLHRSPTNCFWRPRGLPLGLFTLETDV